MWERECSMYSVSNLSWPLSPFSGPILEAAAPHISRPGYNNEWWYCNLFWGGGAARPLEYQQIDFLPTPVLPHFFSVATSGTPYQPTDVAQLGSGIESSLPSPTIEPTPLPVPQLVNSDAIVTHQETQGTIPGPSPAPVNLAATIQATVQTLLPGATIALGELSIKAAMQTEQPNVIRLGSATLSAGGPAYTSGSHVFSFAPSALMIDGTTAATLSPVNTQKSSATVTLGTAVVSFQQTAPRTVHFGSVLLSVGGPAYTTDGHTISLAAGGIIIDGTSTVRLAASETSSKTLPTLPILQESNLPSSEAPGLLPSSKEPPKNSGPPQTGSLSWTLSSLTSVFALFVIFL
jgi:hypothetical protein